MASLADKLAALVNPEPSLLDPEEDQDVTAAKVVLIQHVEWGRKFQKRLW